MQAKNVGDSGPTMEHIRTLLKFIRHLGNTVTEPVEVMHAIVLTFSQSPSLYRCRYPVVTLSRS